MKMNEYIFTTKHTVLIEADNKEEATEIYENLVDKGALTNGWSNVTITDDYGDISIGAWQHGSSKGV
jgi:predicted 3-demethylubiquinone-9 3-methyltransferase (glyoxalase superfamily)